MGARERRRWLTSPNNTRLIRQCRVRVLLVNHIPSQNPSRIPSQSAWRVYQKNFFKGKRNMEGIITGLATGSNMHDTPLANWHWKQLCSTRAMDLFEAILNFNFAFAERSRSGSDESAEIHQFLLKPYNRKWPTALDGRHRYSRRHLHPIIGHLCTFL